MTPLVGATLTPSLQSWILCYPSSVLGARCAAYSVRVPAMDSQRANAHYFLTRWTRSSWSRRILEYIHVFPFAPHPQYRRQRTRPLSNLDRVLPLCTMPFLVLASPNAVCDHYTSQGGLVGSFLHSGPPWNQVPHIAWDMTSSHSLS